ncbi:polyphosphate polymerase domain-containing protein [Candidatus Saccharibacteria bacterium]|nr:polyphosphate polymerase domain-containing protein [Candidatus Saccharibacteria bacterium]
MTTIATTKKAQEVFRRVETKYILTPAEFKALLEIIAPYIEKDRYFKATNCSVYYDTDSRYLAIHSMEKPLYKEKIRIRSYNVPKSLDDEIFIEIKKKYNGIGSKRRITTTLKDFYHYEKTGELKTENAQIKAELDHCFNFYHLKPALYVAYDRLSFSGKNDDNFRLTFDQNVRSREDNLQLEYGDAGDHYFKNHEIVMEVKVLDAYPIWFTRALSHLHIYPASFSKYGRIYEQRLNAREEKPIVRRVYQNLEIPAEENILLNRLSLERSN